MEREARSQLPQIPLAPVNPIRVTERAQKLATEILRPGDVAVLAGDLNVPPHASPALERLAVQGFSAPAPWIDQILVRGAATHGPPVTWPAEARARPDGLLLSDHAPVEVTIA